MPGDLPVGTRLLIEAYDKDKINEEGLRVAGDSFTFTFIFPEGKGLPKEDYILTMGFDNDVNEDNIGIYYLNETESIWEERGGDLDEGNQTITLPVPHFSTYAVLEKVIDDEKDQEAPGETPVDDEQGDPKDEEQPGKDADDK